MCVLFQYLNHSLATCIKILPPKFQKKKQLLISTLFLFNEIYPTPMIMAASVVGGGNEGGGKEGGRKESFSFIFFSPILLQMILRIFGQ